MWLLLTTGAGMAVTRLNTADSISFLRPLGRCASPGRMSKICPNGNRGTASGQRLPSPTQNPTRHNANPNPPAKQPDSSLLSRMGVPRGRPPGVGWRVPSPFLKQSNPCLKLQNNQNPTPCTTRNPQKIPLGVVQSKQLRVQSKFNQPSIKTPPSSLCAHRLWSTIPPNHRAHP